MSIARNGFALFRGNLVAFILIFSFCDQLARGVNGNILGCPNCRPEDCINQGPGIYPQYKCLTPVTADSDLKALAKSTIAGHVDTGSLGLTSTETAVLMLNIAGVLGIVLLLLAVFYLTKKIQLLRNDNGKLAEQLSMVQRDVESLKEPRTQARTRDRINGTRDNDNFGNQEERQPMMNHYQTAQPSNAKPSVLYTNPAN